MLHRVPIALQLAWANLVRERDRQRQRESQRQRQAETETEAEAETETETEGESAGRHKGGLEPCRREQRRDYIG